MANEPLMTSATWRVVCTFLAPDVRDLSGADIARETGLASGSLYPILNRLEKAGWLASKWEVGDPALLKRPRRRLYRITAVGVQRSREAARQMQESFGVPAWA